MKLPTSAVLLSLISTLPLLTTASPYLDGLLYKRQACPAGDVICGVLCFDAGYTCCPSQDRACPPDTECQLGSNGEYGCCPLGEVCSGDGGVSEDPTVQTATGSITSVSTNTASETSEIIATSTTGTNTSETEISSAVVGSGRSTAVSGTTTRSSSTTTNASSTGASSSSGAATAVFRPSFYDSLVKLTVLCSAVVFGLMVWL